MLPLREEGRGMEQISAVINDDAPNIIAVKMFFFHQKVEPTKNFAKTVL
jgi:hypothetical protein